VRPSPRIAPVHRADDSGTTDNFTKFLAATAVGDWTSGSGAKWKAAGGQAETGNGAVAAAVAESDGAIGYVEWSYAQANGLNVARVGNGAGQFAELTRDAAGRAAAAAKITGGQGDLQLGIDYRGTVAGAYPIILVTYEVVCAHGLLAASLTLVKSFLRYASSPAGQAAVARLGYAPLPEALRGKVAAAVDGLT
jgi:phosphate transport system substrate-binding protein